MGKQTWKPGNMLYPIPAVMVSVADKQGEENIITVAWTGTVCSDPAMVYISVRPERHSYQMIKETKEFVINLTTKDLARATDYCGVVSGRDVDKWQEMKLTKGEAQTLSYASIIEECPVNIECKVTEIKELGTHHMFLAEVTAVRVSEEYMNQDGKFELNQTGLMAYSHGTYLELGAQIGTFGYSVRKKRGANENRNRGNSKKGK
ncbi:MAG: flavin reductase family protein [Lachnospiraceae bacterium]|nr:flavin reductase family protein [Lachnospiraceae bacterium]